MRGERGHQRWFDVFASAVARWAGHAGAFAIAFAIVLFWALCGPIFGFSDTWQLVINTATTVLTFLMVFVIQNTLNRDSMALHLKIDELLRVTNEARDALIGAERDPEARAPGGGGRRGIRAEPERRSRTALRLTHARGRGRPKGVPGLSIPRCDRYDFRSARISCCFPILERPGMFLRLASS